MSVNSTERREAAATWGWRILVVLYLLLAVNGVYLFFFQLAPATFERDTGLSLAEVEGAYGLVIDYLAYEVRLAALLLTGVALMGFVAALSGLRGGGRSLWRTLWVPPLLLAAVAVLILSIGQSGVALYYLFMTAVALVSQLLAGQRPAAPTRS